MLLSKFPLWIFLVALLGIFCFGVKKAGKNEYQENFLSQQACKGLRGFCALGIVLHHLTQRVSDYGKVNLGITNLSLYIGVAFTGMFMFLSGYGLYTSYKNKPDYLDKFLIRRIPSILIPFYVGNTLFVLGSKLCGYHLNTSDYIKGFLGILLINSQLWFLVELVILYIAFYLCYKGKAYISENVSYIMIGVFCVVLIVGSLLLGHDFKTVSGGAWFHGEWWYNATILFYIGITVAKFQSGIVMALKKHYRSFLGLSILGIVVFYYLTRYQMMIGGYWYENVNYHGYKEKFMTLLFHVPFIFFAVITLLILSLKFRFKNHALDFLSSISLEIYICQNFYLIMLQNLIKTNVLYMLAVYTCTILTAFVLHVVDTKLLLLLHPVKKTVSVIN